MFGKPEKKQQTLPNLNITKMPDDFYAGANPIIKFLTVEKVVKPAKIETPVLSPAEKKLLDKKTAVGAGNKLHPVNLITNWKFLIFSSIVILLIGGLVSGLYFWWQYRKTLPSFQPPIQPVVTEPLNTQPNSSEIIVTEPVVVETVLPVVVTEAKLDFPSLFLGDSMDTDKDEISNTSEDLFGTDSAVSDSDGDKFTDGHEVYYLYNPAGKEPLKLIDSGLVSLYTNPAFLYKIYYPKTWAVGNVDEGYKDVLFSTFTGENIEIRVMDMVSGETFNDWFARNGSGESLADYSSFESVFKESGFSRKDGLVYFFQNGNKIFSIIYHTTDSTVVNYRQVIKMLARSFQFGDVNDISTRPIEENLNNPNVTSSVISDIITSTNTPL
ncbi:MAG: hypothetical protein A2537_02015 [Candidatus Magasanikbacteria bacterium RIFOXYD2_FULL_36_9]|uniref:Uncharacterized protein n=1 Tax=Candidatus Magasanikbacteria bacterium RIFOXYD2_FULL_36_9 TaxID=1798707 RepID=A0A1F6P265_9BACT|nr:MAG: hypothetical protein A2537_02015 [Candidatus Magasanikbacteria bacterium RIFOXYD2_FULL_36_9]